MRRSAITGGLTRSPRRSTESAAGVFIDDPHPLVIRSQASSHARGLVRLRVGEEPLPGEVFPLELLEAFRVVSLQPAELITPPVVRRRRKLQLAAQIGDVSPRPASDRTAPTLRTTCSGEGRLLNAMTIKPSACIGGKQTLTRSRPTDRGRAIRRVGS